ncbi:MAG: hypothetical protein IJ722_00755 [Alloprevotella sp.]|nr:hypothetical protein [Alloprevotella sp.]
MDNHLDFNRQRSIKSCILDGWKVFALRWRAYLRFQWPALLLAALFVGLLLLGAASYLDAYLLPAAALREIGTPNEIVRQVALPEKGFLLQATIVATAALAAWMLWKGTLYTQMRECRHYGELPAGQPFRLWRSILRNAARCCAADALLALLWLLPCAAIVWAAFAWSKWLLLLLLPLVVAAKVTGTEVEIRHVLDGASLHTAFRQAYGSGLRQAGGLFLIRLLTAIPWSLLGLAAMLPVIALTLASATNTNGLLMGDPDGLPSYFYLLFYGVAAAAAFLIFLITGVRSWGCALKLSSGNAAERALPGAATAKENERSATSDLAQGSGRM